MDVFLAVLGPTLAIIGLFMTWLRFKLLDQEHRFKLFDRRMEVYDSVVKLRSDLHKEGRIKKEAMDDFDRDHRSGYFLFSRQTRDAIKGVL